MNDRVPSMAIGSANSLIALRRGFVGTSGGGSDVVLHRL